MTNILDLFKSTFYLDETSPSYLRWKITVTNRVQKDSVAGNINSHGYWRVTYKNKSYSVHLIVLSLSANAYYPDLFVDHIDNCPSNNSPNNLRWVSLSDQNKNRRLWGYETMDNNLNSFEKTKSSSTTH